MIITKITVSGYKNIKDVVLVPDKKMNIFCGENAQGKTNLVEAIWICTGCRSFRGARDKEIIGFNEIKAGIRVEFLDKNRPQTVEFLLMKESQKEKRILLNGVKMEQVSKIFGNLKCIVFTPDDPEIAKGAPEKRRVFLDLAISQIKIGYLAAITKYENLLTQRNALLKEIFMENEKEEALDVWDEQISVTGAYIALLRDTYTRKMNAFANSKYLRLSHEKENLCLSFQCSAIKDFAGRTDYKGELATEYLERLIATRKEDIRLGYTQIGAQRDDITIKINGLVAKDYASQGQARSAALVMKLSQAEILLEETGDAPVILLDDVLSELDLPRQKFIINEITNMQVFVTCCDAAAVLRHKVGLIAYMKDGKILEEVSFEGKT